MADRLVVMADGEIRQIGTQRDLYERPADRFVAGFVGRSTFLEGRVAEPGIFETAGGLRILCDAATKAGPASLGLRPERIVIGAGEGLDNRLPGTAEFVSYLGALVEVHVRLSEQDKAVVHTANRDGADRIAVGDPVEVGWSRRTGLVFDH